MDPSLIAPGRRAGSPPGNPPRAERMNAVRPVILAAALGGAALLAACSGRAEKASLPPVTPAVRAVRVAKPAARLETGLGRATGTIRAREDATLSAKATGQIKRIRVEVGDRVRAGGAWRRWIRPTPASSDNARRGGSPRLGSPRPSARWPAPGALRSGDLPRPDGTGADWPLWRRSSIRPALACARRAGGDRRHHHGALRRDGDRPLAQRRRHGDPHAGDAAWRSPTGPPRGSAGA
jgi:hypothetical protein